MSAESKVRKISALLMLLQAEISEFGEVTGALMDENSRLKAELAKKQEVKPE